MKPGDLVRVYRGALKRDASLRDVGTFQRDERGIFIGKSRHSGEYYGILMKGQLSFVFNWFVRGLND